MPKPPVKPPVMPANRPCKASCSGDRVVAKPPVGSVCTPPKPVLILNGLNAVSACALSPIRRASVCASLPKPRISLSASMPKPVPNRLPAGPPKKPPTPVNKPPSNSVPASKGLNPVP